MTDSEYKSTRERNFLRSFSLISDQDSDFDEDLAVDFTPGAEEDVDSAFHRNTFERPFSSIHNAPQPFAERSNCWIPSIPVKIEIIKAERNNAHVKIFNPNLYTLQITHGEFQWTIRRRYKHIKDLHEKLTLFRLKLKLPAPTKSMKEKRKSVKGRKKKIPRFPKKPDVLVRDLEKRKRHLQEYLQTLVEISIYKNHNETLKFFEVSNLSFIKKLGKKYKEGAIRKCSGGRHVNIGCCGCLKKFHFAGVWNKRWMIVKDTFIAYVRPKDGRICDVMLMDQDFKVNIGMGSTGAPHGLLIQNMNRNLLAKCWTKRKAEEWKDSIEDAAAGSSGLDFLQENRHDSFAPVRENSYSKWFVDGASYFAAVAEALDNAKEEIFITDWWLSPEIYLKRPIHDGNYWRLDVILERKAKQGVKVFIILYKEMPMTINLDSTYSKHALVSKCPENIKVLRHPDHTPGGTLFWAHHEKIVAIDQRIAFLGGFDLCYGRWDDQNHRLKDLGCITYGNNKGKLDLADVVIAACEKENQTGISFKFDPPTPSEDTRSQADQNSDEMAGCNVPEKNEEDNDTDPQIDELDGKFNDENDGEDVQEMDENETGIGPDFNVEFKEENQNENRANVSSSSSDPQGEPECSCHTCRTEENRHSYSNSSLEEDEYKHLLKSMTNDKQKKGKETCNKDVVEVDVHREKDSFTNLENLGKQENKRSSDSSVKKDVSGNSTSDGTNKVRFSNGCDDIKSNNNNKMSASSKRNLWAKFGSSKHENGDKQKNSKKKGKSLADNKRFSDRDSQGDKSPVQLRRYKTRRNSDEDVTDSVQRERNSHSESSAYNKDKDQTDQGNQRESWALRKLRRSVSLKDHKKDEDGHSGDDEEDRESYLEHIGRKWKLVLNIQKFESAIKSPQQKTPLPDKSQSPKLKSKLKQFQEMYKSKGHRDSVSEIDKMNTEKDILAPPAPLQRTDSERNIDELGIQGSSKFWIGKDYVNFIHKDFVDLQKPFEDFIDRTKTPRMPWHDIGAVVYGKAARDVSRHFIGRWNFTKVIKMKNNPTYPFLLPKSYTVHNMVPMQVKNVCDEVNTQILRSCSTWSSGIRKTECSIQNAYLSAIANAKHYIYIENQFFISQIDDHSVVKNKICEALLKRIVRAHREKKTFRVFVVMPLMPAFEGNISESGGYAIKAVSHYNYTSMSKGPNSLWYNLQKEVIEPLKYICFCGLRRHTELDGKYVSELVYVHSKLMIVDDDTVILGSANINDRSMMGDRDSEIAVLVEDIHKYPVKFDGQEHMVGKFASGLRKELFREHLGMSMKEIEDQLCDPICDVAYKTIWIRRATINTSVFQKVFNCIPDDRVHSYAELREHVKSPPLSETDHKAAQKELKKVKGQLVLMPLRFLEDDNMISSVGKESFLPNYVWT